MIGPDEKAATTELADAESRLSELRQLQAELERRIAALHEVLEVRGGIRSGAIDSQCSKLTAAVCGAGRQRQRICFDDLPKPSPEPAGWEWIEAYREWRRRNFA